MRNDSLFELSGLTMASVSVLPADASEGLTEGHAMTELAGSACSSCNKMLSTPSFVMEDDI